MGRKFLDGEIEIGDVMLAYLLKFQYPKPLMKGFSDYNTKPFINALIWMQANTTSTSGAVTFREYAKETTMPLLRLAP